MGAWNLCEYDRGFDCTQLALISIDRGRWMLRVERATRLVQYWTDDKT